MPTAMITRFFSSGLSTDSSSATRLPAPTIWASK
jgi:hypothetical protein